MLGPTTASRYSLGTGGRCWSMESGEICFCRTNDCAHASRSVREETQRTTNTVCWVSPPASASLECVSIISTPLTSSAGPSWACNEVRLTRFDQGESYKILRTSLARELLKFLPFQGSRPQALADNNIVRAKASVRCIPNLRQASSSNRFPGVSWRKLGRRASLPLAHVDFAAAALEANLVHQLIDEVNAPSVIGIDIFADDGVGDSGRVKARPGITDHNQHAMCFITSHTTLHSLGRIVSAAVANSVRQRLADCRFNLKLLAHSTFHFPGQGQHRFHYWGNGISMCADCNVELHLQLLAFEFTS